jgi:hypothetical protein
MGARWGGWSTPHPAALPPGRRLGTHCVGGWVGPMAGPNWSRGKSRPHGNSIPGPSSPIIITLLLLLLEQTECLSVLPSDCAVVLCVRCSSAPHVAARCCTLQDDSFSFQLTDSLRPQLGHTFGSQLFLVYGGLRLVGNEG